MAFSPTVPDAACGSAFQVLDVETCTLTNVVTFGGGVPDNPECSAYASLDAATRNVSYGPSGTTCDTGIVGWYRFEGLAGNQAADSAPPTSICNTSATGWYDGVHPATPGETIAGTMCFHWSGVVCNWTEPVDITNCGDYYVYNLNGIIWGCNGAYCGQD